jgi:hypothetical protein
MFKISVEWRSPWLLVLVGCVLVGAGATARAADGVEDMKSLPLKGGCPSAEPLDAGGPVEYAAAHGVELLADNPDDPHARHGPALISR